MCVCVCVLERASTRQCPRLAYIIDSVEILSDYLFVWQWEQHQTCVFLKMLPCTLSLSLFWLLIVVDGLLAAIFRLMNFVCGCREKNRNYCTVCMAAWNCLVLCIANGNRFANNYFHFSFWLLLFSLAVLRAHIFFGYFSVFVVVAVCIFGSFKSAYMRSHVENTIFGKNGNSLRAKAIYVQK